MIINYNHCIIIIFIDENKSLWISIFELQKKIVFIAIAIAHFIKGMKRRFITVKY